MTIALGRTDETAQASGSKIRMQLRSPPHLHIDSDFSDVNGRVKLPVGEWIHVVHTYNDGREGRIYINGQLDASATPALDIKTPSRLWIGGWYNNYDFIGDIDEVRISHIARSADWIKLEYENQKPLQTLTGNFGAAWLDVVSFSQPVVQLDQRQSTTLTPRARGAQKI